MIWRPTALGCICLIAAIIAAALEVGGVLEYVLDQKISLALIGAYCFCAAAVPALPAIAELCWRMGRYRDWGIAWCALLIGLLVVVTSTMQRTGHATDAAQQARERAERAKIVAERMEADALRDYRDAQAAALRECDVRAKKCLEAEAKAATLRQALLDARTKLVAAPVEQSDPLARRLAAFFPVSEDQVRLIQPLFVPFLISLLSALFFALWLRVDFKERAAAPETPPQALGPAPAPIPAARATTRQPVKFGGVPAFLVSRTEPEPGEAIEIEGVLYNEYVAWCANGGVEPYNKAQFARELAHVGKAAGLTIEIRGREAYCLDRRLAA